MIAIFLIWAFLSACDINLTGAIPHVCIRKTLGIFPFFFLTFVCWAVAGLSCGRKALQSSLRHVSGWLWDMGSSPLTRAGTWAPAFRAWSLSHWITREVPRAFFCFFFFLISILLVIYILPQSLVTFTKPLVIKVCPCSLSLPAVPLAGNRRRSPVYD